MSEYNYSFIPNAWMGESVQLFHSAVWPNVWPALHTVHVFIVAYGLVERFNLSSHPLNTTGYEGKPSQKKHNQLKI